MQITDEMTRVAALVGVTPAQVAEVLTFLQHSEQHPFCNEALCWCHHNPEYAWEHVGQYLTGGLLTEDEAVLRFSGVYCNVVDHATMPDDVSMYYEPIEERSYDHPGIPAPCWQHCEEEEDEYYPLTRRIDWDSILD